MNRDTIIGFVLIAVVLIGFSWWNQPSAEQIEAARIQDSIAAAQQELAAKAEKTAALAAKQQSANDSSAVAGSPADTTALFYSALTGTSEKVTLKNDKLELTLDTKGGVIRKAVARKYGKATGNKIRIQYGGSMNPKNVKGLMAQPEIDGGLIGGASLKAPDFSQVVNYDK